MGEHNKKNNYKSFKIPSRKQENSYNQLSLDDIFNDIDKVSKEKNEESISSQTDGMYYEIEYDSSPFPGAGKFVLRNQEDVKSQGITRQHEIVNTNDVIKRNEVAKFNAAIKFKEAIKFNEAAEFSKTSEFDEAIKFNEDTEFDEAVEFYETAKSQIITRHEKNEIIDLFSQMREIARRHKSTFDISRFFDKRVRSDNALIFYKQGMFMKDFTDDFKRNAQFSGYFPYYQMLNYEQLRTYFTWRTKVREVMAGDIHISQSMASDIDMPQSMADDVSVSQSIVTDSLSYAFLYTYELLSNIGVETPQEGIKKFIFFWKAFRTYNKSLDKYAPKWIKDYYIYYGLPQSFKKFVEENNIGEHYPNIADTDDSFDLFCAISKYDIRKSAFFSDETVDMIKNCFSFTIERLKEDFKAAGIKFDDVVFRPAKKLVAWTPFKDALFYKWLKQPDRQVVFSENEIYVCSKNEWTYGTIITNEKGKQFISYVMKQMEAVLRKLLKYKFKITVNTSMINQETLKIFTKAGISIEAIVSAAVTDYYKDTTKTVVTVDHALLDRIRQEALITQEALIVEEQVDIKHNSFDQISLPIFDLNTSLDSTDTKPETEVISSFNRLGGGFDELRSALNKNELQALEVVLQGGDLKTFADGCSIMLEVLVDNINEKAMDSIGDNLLDDDFVLYDDYIEQVKELLR